LLRESGKIHCALRGRGAVPRINDVGAGEHCEPGEHCHGDEIVPEESLLALGDRRQIGTGITAVKFDNGTGAGQKIESAESHAVQKGPKAVGGNLHGFDLLSLAEERAGFELGSEFVRHCMT
jgi:hypothetical protein